MRRLPILLSGLLALQVAAAIALALSGPDYGAFEANEPLLAFDPDAVEEVSIDESGGGSVVLRREGDGWTLPGLHGFPADGKKVSALLARLNGLKKGLPVAVSEAAPKRFKLTEEEHERRIVLRGDGGALGDVLLGSSPSHRQVHARTFDGEAVFSVSFALYDAGTKPEDWMDRDLLTIEGDDIVRVDLPSLALVRDKDGLVVEGLGEEQETDGDAAESLLRNLARPGFTAVEGKGAAALAPLGEPDLTVTLTRKDGTAVTYRIKKDPDKDDYLLASSAHDYLFRAPKHAVQPILEASKDRLVKSKGTAPETGDGQTEQAAPDGENPS